MVSITLFLCVVFLTVCVHATIELGGTISIIKNTNTDYQRDIIDGLTKSIILAYAKAHHTQKYGSAYVYAKSSTEYTRAARQFCFGFLFSEMIKQCITINGGQLVSCSLKAGDCVLAYGDKQLDVSNPTNNKSF
jgi:hypothetical protein